MEHTFTTAQILLEDNHLLVINKVAGQLSQGDYTGDTTLAEHLKAYLKDKYNKPGDVYLGIVHRLDRPTSGAMVYARTSKALVRLNEMLRERQVQKTYWAIVEKLPPEDEGTLRHFLLRHGKINVSKPVSPKHKLGKEAILHYKLLKSLHGYHLLEVTLETGRHHQIRAQLSAVGSPIVGDLKYGHKEGLPDASICLHARRIAFSHPVQKEPVSCTAPLPKNKYWDKFA